MTGTRAAVEDGDVLPVGPVVDILKLALESPGHVRRLHVCTKNRLQPPWAAELNLTHLASVLVDVLFASPPALGLKHWRELLPEPCCRLTFGQDFLQGVADVLQDVQARDFGNGKCLRLGLLP